jgi:hypothetical protein
MILSSHLDPYGGVGILSGKLSVQFINRIQSKITRGIITSWNSFQSNPHSLTKESHVKQVSLIHNAEIEILQLPHNS